MHTRHHERARYFDFGSFIFGGTLFGLISSALTVFFLSDDGSILYAAKVLLMLLAFGTFFCILYTVLRGQIWHFVVGRNLYEAKGNLSDSIRSLFNPSLETTTNRDDAVKDILAIFGDYNVRKNLILTILLLFGAITALTSAAFLIRQTRAIEDQSAKLGAQTEAIASQSKSISDQVIDQTELNRITLDLSKSEILYKPYWELKNSTADNQSVAFVKTLGTETWNYSGIDFKNVESTANFNINRFICESCEFDGFSVTNSNWGRIYISDTRIKSGNGFFLSNGTIERFRMFDSTVVGDENDGIYSGGFSDVEIKNFHLYGTRLEDISFSGAIVRIESINNTTLKDVGIFQNSYITVNDTIKGRFEGTVFDSVSIFDSKLQGLDLSTITIVGKLELSNTELTDVTFASNHRECLVMNGEQIHSNVLFLESDSGPHEWKV